MTAAEILSILRKAGKPQVRAEAIAAATRIGTVEVDHGDTHCKTPEAVSYIRKAALRAK